MEKSQNPNFHGIGGGNEDDRRSTVGSLQRREPERIEMSMDKAFKKRQNNIVYRQRKRKDKTSSSSTNFGYDQCPEAENKKLVAENIELKDDNKDLVAGYDQELELLNQRLETQSKELDGLRKTCEKLEEKNAEEHERSRQLESELKRREDKIEHLYGKYVELLEQLKLNQTSETRSNEMLQHIIAEFESELDPRPPSEPQFTPSGLEGFILGRQ